MGFELRDDALSSIPWGFALRVGMPWMRSLPLACVLDLEMEVDGAAVPHEDVQVRIDGADVTVADLAEHHATWWFLQDRLVLHAPGPLAEGEHVVTVAVCLLLPYLSAGPGRPAILPFRLSRRLRLDAEAEPGAFRDVTAGTAQPQGSR